MLTLSDLMYYLELRLYQNTESTQCIYVDEFAVFCVIFHLLSATPTILDKNNGTNDKFYRKVAILMYTEMFNFRPQS